MLRPPVTCADLARAPQSATTLRPARRSASRQASRPPHSCTAYRVALESATVGSMHERTVRARTATGIVGRLHARQCAPLAIPYARAPVGRCDSGRRSQRSPGRAYGTATLPTVLLSSAT